MSEIVNLDDYRQHVTFEALCVQCYARYYAVAPLDVKLKDYQCPNGHIGKVIKTGQPIEREDENHNI